MNKYLILFIFIFVLIFLTPPPIVNLVHHYFAGEQLLRYSIDESNFVSYKFDHYNFDGSLIAKCIKENITNLPNVVIKYYKDKIPNYSYILPSEMLQEFTNYVLTVSEIATQYMNKMNKDSVTITLIISVRDVKNYSFGNYINHVNVVLTKFMNFREKCLIVKNKIAESKGFMLPIMKVYNLLTSDIVVNSWTFLSIIETNNKKLHLVPEFSNNSWLDEITNHKSVLTIGKNEHGIFVHRIKQFL